MFNYANQRAIPGAKIKILVQKVICLRAKAYGKAYDNTLERKY